MAIITEHYKTREDGVVLNRTYSDNEITTVGKYAFNGCNKMTSVNFQNAT